MKVFDSYLWLNSNVLISNSVCSLSLSSLLVTDEGKIGGHKDKNYEEKDQNSDPELRPAREGLWWLGWSVDLSWVFCFFINSKAVFHTMIVDEQAKRLNERISYENMLV